MKHLLSLFILAICLIGCNTKDEPNPHKHQPADSTTWSPVGKRYMRDRSAQHVEGHDYFYEVVWFKTSDSAIWYNSIVKDFTQMNQVYPCSYVINYPNAVLTFFEVNPDQYYFTDTLTLICRTAPDPFTLVK